MMGSCENSNEPLGSIKVEEFIDLLRLPVSEGLVT
jgi:hypothetical protein